MLAPINLQAWIADHKQELVPPVCNRQIYDMGDFIIMAVGGPNRRKDYHDDPGEEWFYQVHGDMLLKVIEASKPRDIWIREGEIFLLPSHVYHSPQRFENTVGLVIERKRQEQELDGFLWFCDACYHLLHQERVLLKNIEQDLPPVFKRFWDDEVLRTCQQCYHTLSH